MEVSIKCKEWNKSTNRKWSIDVDLEECDNIADSGTKNGEVEIGALLQENRWTSKYRYIVKHP